MVNFTNLKTPGGYNAKSKPQGVCLQLSQTSWGDYVIWWININTITLPLSHDQPFSLILSLSLYFQLSFSQLSFSFSFSLLPALFLVLSLHTQKKKTKSVLKRNEGQEKKKKNYTQIQSNGKKPTTLIQPKLLYTDLTKLTHRKSNFMYESQPLLPL